MGLDSAWILFRVLQYYVGIGLLVSPIAIFLGGARIDRALPASSLGFRILILPGAAMLWPIVLVRCLRGGGTPRIERNAHRIGSRV